VFLLDDNGVDAQLRASTGETGQQLIEQGHSLAVGSLSVIGQTTLKGEHVIARSESRNSVHRHNELLPETRLEAAFPLQVEDKIIGALDLQSRENLDLSEEDVRSFQALANTLSLAIDNIRQFEMSRMRVRENQKLAEQARNALREVERLNQRLIGRAWSEYLGGKEETMGINIDFEADTSERDTRWTPSLADAMDSNNIVQDGLTVAIPLRVRGRVIGAMEFELDDDDEFDPDDLELVQEISERFGLAAENTRLVEESQRMAQREALINELSSRFQSARDVEATLAEAARSLSETFMAERVSIRLGVPEKPNRNNGNKG
jgi:GAF domain-containing protein